MALPYGARWEAARLRFLATRPFCVLCREAGRITAASVVDHRIAHRGDHALFWNPANWQPLCATCHNSVKKRQEGPKAPALGGAATGSDAHGMPLDRGHPWNQR